MNLKKIILLQFTVLISIQTLFAHEFTIQKQVFSSGSYISKIGMYSNFGIIGEAIIKKSFSVGQLSGSMGFIYQDIPTLLYTIHGKISFSEQIGKAIIQAFDSNDTTLINVIDTMSYNLISGLTEANFTLSLPDGNYHLRAYIDGNDNLAYDIGESIIDLSDEISVDGLDVIIEEPIVIPDPPLSAAGISIDMDYSTINYQSVVASQDIENTISSSIDNEKWIVIVGQNVSNLDTYQIEINFDPDRLEFLFAIESNPAAGIENLLMKNNGNTLGFQAVEYLSGTVNIANSLIGEDCDIAPENSGILALLKFRILDEDVENHLQLNNVYFVDCEGVNEKITQISDGCFNCYPKWDLNKDGIVNYLDLRELFDHWLLTEKEDRWNDQYNLDYTPQVNTNIQIIDYLDLRVLGDHWLINPS